MVRPILNPKHADHNRKTLEEHRLTGTYRRDRHGALAGYQHTKKPAIQKRRPSKKSQRKWIRSAMDERAWADGCWFHEGLAEHVVQFFAKHLKHSKGRWAGKPFIPTDWQREEIIYPLFGWIGPDGYRRYKKTYIEMPKKLGKSTLASGIGLYMLFADEEPGNEVYSLGADSDQAGIVHREAINMIEASEELNDSVKINRTNGVIVYEREKSYYRKLTGGERGKSGYNFHCGILDELHEWYGDKVWKAIKYAYRARDQGLQFVITNAGFDTQSVCYRQREKAQAILDGKMYDNEFLAIIMCCTEEEARAEVAAVRGGATELPVARRVNPGLGELVPESALLSDIKDAIQTPSELSNLLRFTYGVWEIAENPWLEPHHWQQCFELYSETTLEGHRCWVGMDLASVTDIAAVVAVFPIDDLFYLWPKFYLPEETAFANKHIVDYMQWADAGLITLTPGGTTDFGFIRKDINEMSQVFNVQELIYDPWNAEDISRQIEEEDGITRVKFTQSWGNYAFPTAEFERLLISKRLRHPGNHVLDWMAGHVQVKTDASGNKRPIKPSENDFRKVDGIQASVMGLSRAVTGEGSSIYDERGPVSL